ncbi:BTAD domain-containing putative transcriptional regulator [Actinoplanes sp. NPDC049802]|uniref:AfsR/SARP family transcriptional regulator n=1 Tax=Actinoplanes sp. NPDC049802 TaxID=3154742 RepID=UPI0033EED81E
MGDVTVRAYLLGEFRLVVNGRLIDMGASRRSRDLLAYLLTHRESAAPRDVLCETFWPRARPAAARNSLHVALTGARRMLRPQELIERSLDAYRIVRSARVWTDADEFERRCRDGRRAADPAEAARCLEAAGLLWRGGLLADQPYADWASGRRETLRALALEAQSRLVALYTERGDHGPAATLARRILADDPCNEDVHRGLMLCYARTGLRHLALVQYRHLADTLWDDLRVRPACETTALYERLRRPA